MLEDRKVIGLCMTKIHDRVRGALADEINLAAVEAGFKLICFNSMEDFYKDDVYSKGAQTIYDRMDYDILDGIIICAEHFCDGRIVDNIVSRAKERKVPVVILNGSVSDCVQVYNDCEESFKELIRHVLKVHHVTDPFFLGGRKGDANSVQRLEYYKEVLNEFNIPFDESRVGYGDYWDEPAMKVTEELVVTGKLPQAIICANDYMAFGVIKKLKMLGYFIPKDVIVTGFDGVPAVEYYYPKLTTCRENWQLQAQTCVNVLKKLFAGEAVEKEYKITYGTIISESCGCVSPKPKERDEAAAELFGLLESMEAHEDYVTSETERMLNVEDVGDLLDPLSRFILNHSYVCVSSKFMKIASVEKWDDEKMVAVPCAFDPDRKVRYLHDDDMLPEIREWLEDDTAYILTSVYSKDFYCGYYAVKTSYIGGINYKMKKIVRLANLVCNSLINQFKQRETMRSIEGASFRDPLTGLPNLKGASQWFQDFAADEHNHEKSLSVSIYAIPQYALIYENYGIHVIEEIINLMADRLKAMRGREGFLAKNSESEFLLIHAYDNPKLIEPTNARISSVVQSAITAYNQASDNTYDVEVSMGCTVADPGWNGSLGSFVKYASNEMFLNRMHDGGVAEKLRARDSHVDYIGVFNLLLEHNLFRYHYQPIVDAKTGEIYGYEALMRTKGGINLSPLEILDAARETKRLNEIEHATMFNILKQYSEENEKFHGKKVFINTIPNHFLTEEECTQLTEKYRQYLDQIVFEVTEQDSSSDEEMAALKRFSAGKGGVQIAIDDYGTGHSNIVNLLRYTPQIIKIDHYLISGIDEDINKQMFVKNTIEFAAMNGIKVLAEGVETRSELRTVIEFGVDLIQGFYTGRPAEEPVETVDESILNEIINENLRLSVYNKGKQKVYTARDGEEVNIVDLALRKYNYVHVVSGEVQLIGRKDSSLNSVLRVADNADVRVIMTDVNLTGIDEPAIQLGKGSNVELNINGYNSINKNGILVPTNAKLRMTGNGALLINANDNFTIGIGAKYDEPYGEIIFEHKGRIKVISSGDKIVGVGGGYSLAPITIASGHLEIAGSGISVLGIGSTSGDAFIDIGEAEVTIKESGNQAVGIGTVKGKMKISSNGTLNVISDGERSVGIGSMFGNDCTIMLEKGKVSSVVHCDTGATIGTYSGTGTTVIKDCDVTVYGEGSVVTGIGSSMGNWTTEVTGGILDVKVLSGGGQSFGSDDRMVITGGNIIDRNGGEIVARNAYGQKLHKEIKDMDHFEQVIWTEHGEYVYVADRTKEHEVMCIYLP
jgi:EAL domain-containing protein (putative c-di-GMP-specific phosphodiesterase class I)/DNA-binding LacI/PurR family transcriptional regulator/GGDEF domain-containing protein